MRVGRRKNKIKTTVVGMTAWLVGTAAALGFFDSGAVMRCEARTADEEKEVIDFITAYYEAQTPEGIETLAEFVEKPEDITFQMSLIKLQTLFEHGYTGLKDIHAAAYPLSDGEHWMTVTSQEWVIQGFDVTLPGVEAVFVGRGRDGGLQIESYIDDERADMFLNEMRKISSSDEVTERNHEIAVRYNDIIAEETNVAEWLLEVTDEVEEKQAEAAARFISEREKESEADRGEGETYYVVKKGDCLWRIAEEQLGDGMLWSGIYEANKAVIGEDPNLIYVGIRLQLGE